MSVLHPKLLIAALSMSALAGCVSVGDKKASAPMPPQRSASAQLVVLPPSPAVPYVLRGRYGQQTTQPTPEQQDPLKQIIELRLSPSLQSTVGDALQYVLLRSGYSLCAATPEVTPLFSRPLPSVHYQLGPTSLYQALAVLGGQAWQLQVDPLWRTVCFLQHMPKIPIAPPVAEFTP